MDPVTGRPADLDDADAEALALRAGQVFTPAAPIDQNALFAGRQGQVRQVVDAINQRGQHAMIFGERGVGKTSLANILSSHLTAAMPVISPRINCDGSDDYGSLWRKVFSEIKLFRDVRKIGFQSGADQASQSLMDTLPDEITPDVVKRALFIVSTGAQLIVIVDEFDRVTSKPLRSLLADTIKALSDHAVPVTIVLVGVADSLEELIEQHHSVERALVQVRMPRMSRDELREVVEKGLSMLEMSIDADALDHIATVSQGLPHYTHLLALHASREALAERQRRVTMEHVGLATRTALEKAQQTIRSSYHRATMSQRRDNLYAQVLLACALAPTDDMGYFAPADVRAPMSAIMQKECDISGFSRHLNDFTDPSRGPVLQRTGVKHRYRYRFANPLMQPFVTMLGLIEGRLTASVLGSSDASPAGV